MRTKVIVYGIGAILLIMVAVSLFNLISYERLKIEVFTNPAPLPEGILCVYPEASSDSASATECKYWNNEDVHTHAICVAIDRDLVPEPESFRQRIALLIDGTLEPVIGGGPRGGQVAIDLSERIFYIPNNFIGSSDENTLETPRTYCWLWIDMPKRLYLADLTINSSTQGVIKYRWAFRVIP